MDKFFRGVKDHTLKLDNQFRFYMDLYGHVDGSLRDLVRAKLVQLFQHGVRKAVVPKGQEGGGKGLLDGEEAVTARLLEANKKNEVVEKVSHELVVYSEFSMVLFRTY